MSNFRRIRRGFPVRPALMMAGLIIIVSLAAIFAAGCGDNSSNASTAGDVTSTVSYELSRPAPGTVEVADPPGDALRDDGTPLMNSSMIDIEKAAIAKDGTNLVFSLTVGEPIPSVKPADILGIEWGILLDTNDDGEPEWGLYTAYPEGSLAYGLYNQQTKERLQDSQFPGTFAIDGSTITMSLQQTAIGSPQSFQWIAYTDAGNIPADEQDPVRKIGDTVPSNAWPKGSNWLSYP